MFWFLVLSSRCLVYIYMGLIWKIAFCLVESTLDRGDVQLKDEEARVCSTNRNERRSQCAPLTHSLTHLPTLTPSPAQTRSKSPACRPPYKPHNHRLSQANSFHHRFQGTSGDSCVMAVQCRSREAPADPTLNRRSTCCAF